MSDDECKQECKQPTSPVSSHEEEEPNYKAFDKIQKFLRALKETFGNEHTNVAKYYALCKKINFDNHMAIRVQNKIFSSYCSSNREAIKHGELAALNDHSIVVNDKIQFCLKTVLEKSKPDAATARSIVKHLQYILYCLHPDSDLKTALVSTPSSSSSTSSTSGATPSSGATSEGKSKEEQLFDTLLGKMSNKYSDVSDPAQAFTDLQSGNFMQEIQQTIGTGIDSGEIDPSKLLSNAFGMFSKLKGEVNDPGLMGMMSMVEGMLNQAKGAMN
jgi:hypothetical protein